jgi:flagellar hook-associated protein 2
MSTTSTPAFTAGGLASGLDTASIIDGLVGIRQVSITSLKNKQAGFQSNISVYGDLASKLNALQGIVDDLGKNGLQATNVTSTAAAFSASTTNAAQAGHYSVEVTALAQAAKARSQSFTSAQAPVTGGNLALTISGGTYNVAITDGMELADVAKAINTSGAPVSANVLSTGSGFYLSIANRNTGYIPGQLPASALSIAETSTGTLGQKLSASLFQQASNAAFTVDGLPFSRQSSVVTDAIPGVTLSLNHLSTAGEESLDVTSDTAGSQARLQTFVTAYNVIQSELSTELAAPKDGASAGDMSGDSALTALQGRLQSLTSAVVPGLSGVRSLADLGVKTARDGTLSLDAAVFTRGFNASPASASALFGQSSTGIASVMDGLVKMMTDSVKGTLTIRQNGLRTTIKSLSDQQTQLQNGVDAYRAQLQAQFTAMENIVSSLKNQSQFLTQNESLFGLSSSSKK